MIRERGLILLVLPDDVSAGSQGSPCFVIGASLAPRSAMVVLLSAMVVLAAVRPRQARIEGSDGREKRESRRITGGYCRK